jgi:hypothetical protein
MAGQANVGTAEITLPAGSRQVTFTVIQTNPAAAFQVPFRVSDSCSAINVGGPGSPVNGPVNKFVGGGKDSLGN